MQTNTQKRIGILRGGEERYYKSSLKKGGDIILYLHENLLNKYKPIDILVDRDHIWHCNGTPTNPSDLMHQVDIIWNTSHPSFSNILQSLSIPYIGVGFFTGTLLSDREIFRKHVKDIGIQMPRHIIGPKSAKEVFEKISPPWIVNGELIKTFPELIRSIEDRVNHGQSIVIEEFIAGNPSTTHSVAGYRGEDIYVFPVQDISENEKQKIISIAKKLHKYLDIKHYLKSEFILHPTGQIYLRHIELTPDFKKDSHFHQVCETVGAKAHEIVEHILERVF